MVGEVSQATLITGCSTGIGRATALALAKGGLTVYATARRPETLKDLEPYGCKILGLDVCDEASMRAAVQAVEAAHGAVGILINNAGYGSEGPVEEVSMEEVRRQFETNFFGLLQLTKLVIPGMRKQGWGKIVNLSSMGGRMTLPGGGIYHATKYAVEALSDALRFELQGFGIDVIVIEPGMIRTHFNDTAIRHVERVADRIADYDDFRIQVTQNIQDASDGMMARMAGTADDVAKTIARALTARHPKARYPVTLHARMFMGSRRWLGDRGWDLFLRGFFKPPQPAS
jgi:NAD(P)-dependent dehydrogenase (short-subunit alcohol dehydrogenase family)